MGLQATQCRIEVPREDLLLPSLRALRRCSEQDLRAGAIRIKWENEPGLDAGGLSKDWFGALAKAITNGSAGLMQSGDTGASIDLRADAIHGFEARWLFKVIGIFFAKALVDEQPVGISFNQILLAHFLGRPPCMEDVRVADPSMHRGLQWVQENDVTHADLTFSASYELFGESKEIVLTEEGPVPVAKDAGAGLSPSQSPALAVTEDNKAMYIERMMSWLTHSRFEPSLGYMLDGFHSIVPTLALRHFRTDEIQVATITEP